MQQNEFVILSIVGDYNKNLPIEILNVPTEGTTDLAASCLKIQDESIPGRATSLNTCHDQTRHPKVMAKVSTISRVAQSLMPNNGEPQRT